LRIRRFAAADLHLIYAALKAAKAPLQIGLEVVDILKPDMKPPLPVPPAPIW